MKSADSWCYRENEAAKEKWDKELKREIALKLHDASFVKNQSRIHMLANYISKKQNMGDIIWAFGSNPS